VYRCEVDSTTGRAAAAAGAALQGYGHIGATRGAGASELILASRRISGRIAVALIHSVLVYFYAYKAVSKHLVSVLI
jgi:hypothetical protein